MSRRASGLRSDDGPTLEQAAAEFLGGLDGQTARSYGQTLRRLCLALGGRLPLASLSADDVARVFDTAWGRTAARTWNRHRSATRSFGAWAGLADLTANVDRRPQTPCETAYLGAEVLDALWRLPGLPLREHTLWRLLHESGAGVRAVLSLDVEDLDLDDRRARAGAGWVGWRSGTAGLLPELLGGRRRGPLFLADRRPAPARPVAAADLCPETGRGRLSYERAEYLFKHTTRPLDPAGDGYTLRQLRSRQPKRRRPQ
nr:site-specific integrase [Actinophytocola oryzae]